MGRPSFLPSQEQRDQVSAWLQERVSIEEMARRIGVTSKTFRKSFAAQLPQKSGETVKTESAPAPPPYQPSPEERRVVLIMAAVHGPEDEIARALGISVEQLNASFAKELSDGPAIGYREGVESLYDQMKARNTTATKAWLILCAQADRMAQPKGIESQPASNGLKGKKEQAAEAAQNAVSAGSRFAPLAPPKLVVNNDG
jgi:transposase-like protein